MTHIYIAQLCQPEYSLPIAASDTFNGLLDAVDDYYGPENKRGVWFPNNSKYFENYQGHILYGVKDIRTGEYENETIKIYCIDFNLGEYEKLY